jgi:4-diphosphocytidyl-2-C-methyl-D-erythritol kinase
MSIMICEQQVAIVSKGLLVHAPAKINLCLLIAGKRPDGFHQIETVMAKINWFDEILIEHGRKKNGIELICQGPYWAPLGKENLVYKACELLLDCCRLQANIKITLTKNIPAGTGLGSASSDAAATLIGVNAFLKSPVSEEKLYELAAGLGSDVAFFLDGPLAFCTGRGEEIKKLDENFDFHAFIIIPDINVSTKEVYANYKHNSALYEELNSRINHHIQKNRIDLLAKMCANMLETSCFSLYGKIAEIKAKAESFGMGAVCLTGSGSAMFCIMNNEQKQKAEGYRCKLEKEIGCKSVFVTNNKW